MEYVRQNPKEICNLAIISPKMYVLIIFSSQATSHIYAYTSMYYKMDNNNDNKTKIKRNSFKDLSKIERFA